MSGSKVLVRTTQDLTRVEVMLRSNVALGGVVRHCGLVSSLWLTDVGQEAEEAIAGKKGGPLFEPLLKRHKRLF